LHAPFDPHAKTYVPLPAPYINDDESTHSDNGSNLSSEYDLEDDEHVDDEPPQIPMWAQTTL